MINVSIKDDSFNRERKKFIKLSSAVKDLRPVWKQFIPFYQDTIVEAAFNTQGKIMGRSWANLSPAYLKRIQRGEISGTKMKRSETLYRAAKGDAGWFQKMGKKFLEFGLNSPVWAGVHAWGFPQRNILRRDYFQTVNDGIPPRADAFLALTTDNYLKGSFK